MRLLVVIIFSLATLMLTGSAYATSDCGQGCWGAFADGTWLPPEQVPQEIIDAIEGGDGVACMVQLQECLDAIDQGDIDRNPCAYIFVCGDDGHIVVCGVWVICNQHYTSMASNSSDGNPNHEFEDGPPPQDPYEDQGGTQYVNCWDPGQEDNPDCW